MGSEKLMWVGGLSAVVSLIIVVIICHADQTVDFEHNAIILSIGGNVKGSVGPGRHWYGIGCDVVTFDRFDTNVEFTEASGTQIDVRVQDGQKVKIDVSFQYGIPKESLKNIYAMHKTNFHHTLEYAAKSILRDVASLYPAEEFFSKRAEIETKMRDQLVTEADERKIQVHGFQVRNIGLPDALNARQIEVEMKNLDANAKNEELELDKIKANASLIQVTLEAHRTKFITEIEQQTIVIETKEIQTMKQIQEITKQKISKITEEGARNVSLFHKETDIAVEEIEFSIEREKQITKRLVDEIRVSGETNLTVYNQRTENKRLDYEKQLAIYNEETHRLVESLRSEEKRAVNTFRANLETKRAVAEGQAAILLTQIKQTNKNELFNSRFAAYDGLDGSVFLAEEIADANLGNVQYMDVKQDTLIEQATGHSSIYTEEANKEEEEEEGGGRRL